MFVDVITIFCNGVFIVMTNGVVLSRTGNDTGLSVL